VDLGRGEWGKKKCWHFSTNKGEYFCPAENMVKKKWFRRTSIKPKFTLSFGCGEWGKKKSGCLLRYRHPKGPKMWSFSLFYTKIYKCHKNHPLAHQTVA